MVGGVDGAGGATPNRGYKLRIVYDFGRSASSEASKIIGSSGEIQIGKETRRDLFRLRHTHTLQSSLMHY